MKVEISKAVVTGRWVCLSSMSEELAMNDVGEGVLGHCKSAERK